MNNKLILMYEDFVLSDVDNVLICKSCNKNIQLPGVAFQGGTDEISLATMIALANAHMEEE